ncbi:MAG: 3-oxoacyl-ACP reductase FabG [Proteobacteria bacterium]|nr:3-oxoacyl-ACP reductase FabG [Pseudomonadota bacterium]MBU4297117.1 3-oxoacyl-ACP reductase FabG [Pseudomonadota bacterium]MCG2746539.1 3-oxoacyl-ACP reductase FabG [Desulfobulbaceae bacterium]
MSEFTGQKVVVTGATRGLGRAISLAFLQQGATVVGLYGGNVQSAADFQQECIAFGDLLQLYQCDVSDYAAVEELYGHIEQKFDTIDILVNNAGIRRDSVLAMMKEDDWRRVIDVNLTGSYIMAKFAVQLMMKQKYGRIIFITSPMSHMGFAGQANYAASKAGQIGMMKSLSKETAKRKITVNCVSPGFIATELINDLNPDQLSEYKKMVPMRRFGTPAEVADAVLFLAGPKASYINGAVLDVNGGL